MANIKRNKGIKGPTIAICSIATVALVGVGFAAWVISGSSSASLEGNIQVDVVNDTSYPIVLNGWEDGKGSIIFGIPEGSESESNTYSHASWLSATTASGTSGETFVGYENLSVTLNFDVYNVSVGDDLSQILSATLTSEAYEGTTSYTKGYVSGLPSQEAGTLKLSYLENGASSGTEYTEITSSALTESDIMSSTDSNNPGNYVACQATATFSWGPAFQNMNPYEFSYYVEDYETNGSNSSNSVVDSSYISAMDGSSEVAITSQLLFSQALQQLETDFEDVTFTLTITASSN